MSNPKDTPEQPTATNGEWTDPDTVGMLWEGSMFPNMPRESRFYGFQDPLDFVPRKLHLFSTWQLFTDSLRSSGSPDDENGDDSWRKRAQGTLVYTGEGWVKAPRPPSPREQAGRQKFWDGYDAQRAQLAAAHTQGQAQSSGPLWPAASEELRFPDALPTRSVTAPALLAQHQFSAPLPSLSPVPAPQAPATTPLPAARLPASSNPPQSSVVDGENKLDDGYLPPDAPQDPPTSTNTVDREQIPPTSSPRIVDGWNDADLLTLWKHKVIRKKGYEPMLVLFPGQTAESLHEAWTTHKELCKQLGAVWEAAGRPNGLLSEWLEE